MASRGRPSLVLGAIVLLTWYCCVMFASGRRPRNNSTGRGFRVDIIRRDALQEGRDNMTLMQRISRTVERSRNRQLRIKAILARNGAATPIHAGDGEFLMRVAVGTPPVRFDAIMDTGSDLVWTQCKPCIRCYKQPTRIFDPAKSSTYAKVPCGAPLCRALDDLTSCASGCKYMYEYGDNSRTHGMLSTETLTLGNRDRFPRITFGCGNDNGGVGLNQSGGIVGLGRGPLSLISQLGRRVQKKFSYCLMPITDPASRSSPLLFGRPVNLGEGAKTVPYLPSSMSTYYYLPLQGFSVDGSAVAIPGGAFDPGLDGDGGVIIDSGTTVTILDDAAYAPLKQAFVKAIKVKPTDPLDSGLDLCYKSGSLRRQGKLPRLALHFQGGVDWELPDENYFLDDPTTGLTCLTVLSTAEIGGGGPSILGNILQQNFHVLYDNGRNTLSFKPASCASL